MSEEIPRLPVGLLRVQKVRLTPNSAVRFEARTCNRQGAAELLRKIADVVEKDKDLPPRVIVQIEVGN